MSEVNKKAIHSEAKFLIVDDDPAILQTVQEYLMSFGYNYLYTANNGKEAITLLKKQPIDFIISDWSMPEMTGLDLLRYVRSDETFQEIAFVIVTAPVREEREKIEEAVSARVDDYIIKPFRSQILKEKIEYVMLEKFFHLRKGVLIVDDDIEVRQTLIEYLNRMEYTPIYEAENGADGLKILRDHVDRIGLVLSDWDMPKLSGIDFLAHIRAEHQMSYMPFVMITAQFSGEIERVKLQMALDEGVDHYLLKPFRFEDIKAKITFVTRKAKQRIEIQKKLIRAQNAIDAEFWADATVIYHNILSFDPKNVRAYLGLAKIEFNMDPAGGLKRAIQYIEKVIEINPKFEQAYLNFADLYAQAGFNQKAVEVLKNAIQLCGVSHQLQYHLGKLLIEAGEHAEGMVALQKAIELRPDFKEALDYLNSQHA